MMFSPRIAISPISPAGVSLPSMSTSFISQPGMARPIVPGLVGLSGMLNDATGEVSDRP
jgi:hypothetical protein